MAEPSVETARVRALLAKHYPHPVFGCECTPTDGASGVKETLTMSWEEHVAELLCSPKDGESNDYTTVWAAVEHVEARIDNLWSVVARWDRPGGSSRLAQRARDKAEGMETALRLLGVPERGVFSDPLIHALLTRPDLRTPPGPADGGGSS